MKNKLTSFALSIFLASCVFGQQQPSRDVSRETARSSQEWVKDAVIYQIWERAYSQKGDFNSITADLDRIGMLSFDAWRACRLVVDTGIHALGWSRTRAIEFMCEHTALARNNIENEVDRYIGWPGQATAYKTGQMEIQRLRAEAEARRGSAFDLRRFHDAVLGHGAVALATLRAIVESET